jgi:hypothetical protein
VDLLSGRAGERRALAGVPLALLLLLGGTHGAAAQLISPGKLAAAHSDLEGIRRCTSCHELGKRGVSDAKCLACHTPLEARIEAKKGYHATLVGQPCASCHKDHLGPDAALVRFDTTAFDHARTGYRLDGKHAGAACHSCHKPAFITASDVRAFQGRHGTLASTYLGLGTACVDCHTSDDPHHGQFQGRACSSCHTTETWKKAPGFDHDRARYRLSGAHRTVDCEKCHRTERNSSGHWVRYTSLSFGKCTSCHEDPHGGGMGPECTSCHTTSGWKKLDRSTFERRFDHAKTDFKLVGRHASISCASCHVAGTAPDSSIRMAFKPGTSSRPYPPPVANNCRSCHLDYHHGVFDALADSGACGSCHTQDDWKPSTFDLFRHDRETTYKLEGAHRAVPCEGCHDNPKLGQTHLTFRFDHVTCRTCHERTDDPHHGQFGDAACESCHTDASFQDAPRFDHGRTRFPLTGAHADVPCASCHKKERFPDGSMVVRYRPLGIECRDCHANRGAA